MRLTLSQLNLVKKGIRSKSQIKVFRKSAKGWEMISDKDLIVESTNATQTQLSKSDLKEETQNDENGPDYRQNEMKIQMLSKPLYEQVFKNCVKSSPNNELVNK